MGLNIGNAIPWEEDSFNELNAGAHKLQILEKLHPELFSGNFLKQSSVTARQGVEVKPHDHNKAKF